MNYKIKISENNLPDKKGLSKTVISLIAAIVILVAGIGLLTINYIELMNKNTQLMNENIELTEELSETRRKLKKTSNNLVTAKFNLELTKSKLEEATFELGEDMLTFPKRSRKFDCDDSSLYMYLYFTNLGYDVQIIAGNLDLEDETYRQTNHIWVIVDGGIEGDLAYDWGHFCFDEQHYYGYILSYRDLLKDALRD